MDQQNILPNQGRQIPLGVKDFLNSILEDANMSNIDPAMREEMIQELFTKLDDFMLTTIIEGLPEEKLDEFTRMAENGSDRNQLENYLKANVPNSQKIFARAMLEFRDIYIGEQTHS